MSMFGQSRMGPKSAASLSSTLLARKGQAKPAMRPQGFGAMPGGAESEEPGVQEDLGWNDMGFDATQEPPVPPVLVQREVLREEFAEPAPAVPDATPDIDDLPPVVELKPVSVATAARIGREAGKKHSKRHPRAAFTLRLDEERHLRLRLASALHNASAQILVTAALDRFLHALPEVEDLVRQLPARTGR